MTALDAPVEVLPTPAADRPLTVDDLAAMPDGERYELEDGRLVERKPMAFYEDRVTQATSSYLYVFNAATGGRGAVFGDQTTLRIFGPGETGKRADVAYVRLDRLPANVNDLSVLTVPPDLVVEVVSPNDAAHEVEAKVERYLDAGVGEVWVIFTNTRTLTRRWPGGRSPEVLRAGQTLSGDGPLAGLSLPIADLFPPRPEPAEPTTGAA